MAAGWLYYHKYPPKRKCNVCGKRHYAKRMGVASNGEDFWEVICTQTQGNGGRGIITAYTGLLEQPAKKGESDENL